MPAHHAEDKTSQDSLTSLYARCLEEIRQRLDQTALLTADTFQAVAYAVRDSLTNTSGVHQEDLQQVIDTMVRRWQQVLTDSDQVRHEFLHRDAMQALAEHGMSLLAQLAGTVQTLAGEVESRLQRELAYHTGTVVGSGNFSCMQCDKEIRKYKPGPLPPCRRCHGTVFRRRV
ncbi:MAG TPA: hypothetical protein VIH59_36385 [Candidatus Tectomicrobia bacterium]|jgi:hypothetical protein